MTHSQDTDTPTGLWPKLARLNPLNSLFGRLFLWFWLVIVLITATSIWLATEFNTEGKFSRVPQYHQQHIKRIAQHIIKSSQRPQFNGSVEQVLKYIGRKTHTALILYQPESQAFYYWVKPKHRPSQQQILKLLKRDKLRALNLTSSQLIGPLSLTIGPDGYQLFMLRHQEPSLVRQLRQQHPGLLLFIAVAVSGLLCLLLTWSIARPIRRLQAAVRNVASGDLSTRVDESHYSRDEIGQLAREFNRMSAQVESLMHGQKQLLADISHELRTPLARLNLVIGIAQENEDIPPAHLQRIEKEAHLIEEMVARILQLSRLESRSIEPHKVKTDLTSLLGPLVDDAQYEAQGQDKSLSSDLSSVSEMNLDPALIASAVENVLRNGLKYASHQVSIRLFETDKQVHILIIDDGDGLEQQELDRIFTPFYRVSSARNRNNGGIGLGLAIAQQAVQVHQGNIQAKNRETSGLEVEIILPKTTEK